MERQVGMDDETQTQTIIQVEISGFFLLLRIYIWSWLKRHLSNTTKKMLNARGVTQLTFLREKKKRLSQIWSDPTQSTARTVQVDLVLRQ